MQGCEFCPELGTQVPVKNWAEDALIYSVFFYWQVSHPLPERAGCHCPVLLDCYFAVVIWPKWHRAVDATIRTQSLSLALTLITQCCHCLSYFIVPNSFYLYHFVQPKSAFQMQRQIFYLVFGYLHFSFAMLEVPELICMCGHMKKPPTGSLLSCRVSNKHGICNLARDFI